MSLNKPLQIRDASAGSGKTYSLVQHYLKLLLQENEDRAELGEIIAMTFTNKAALEMKTRILEDLSKLAFNDPKHIEFIKATALFVGIKEEQVVRNSQLVLRKLLHQYEEFNVMTIDKFNLRLIRTFSRDLDLPENFEILIQKDELIDRSINELLLQIDAKDKSELQRIALQFGNEKLNEEGSWNIKNDILKKAKYLLSEKDLGTIDKLVNTSFSEQEEAELKAKHQHLFQEYQRLTNTIVSIYSSKQYDTKQLAGGSTFEKGIIKLAENKSLNDGLNDLSEAQKANLEKTKEKTDFQEVASCYYEYTKWKEKYGEELIKLHLAQQQLTSIKLLRELAIYLNGLRTREATILVAEFNQLVTALLRDQEAPFIYERLGAKFKHFFLDEFQDTSLLQWRNLIPLVHESLSTNQFNFIVGDPKQSIYRFKNGLADQFIALPGIYNPERDPILEQKSEYFEEQGNKTPLLDNWRSAKEIVEFNNTFFERLRHTLPERTIKFYESVHQNPKGKEGGYLRFEWVKKGNAFNEEDDSEFSDLTSSKCLEYVQDAISDGFKPGDICILGRKSDICLQIATTLKLKGYQVVSADSLSVNSGFEVRMLVHYLGWRLRPTNYKKAALFASSYFEHKYGEKHFEYYMQCFNSNETKVFSIEEFFKTTGIGEEQWIAGFTSIYSCLEGILELIGLNKTNNVYLKQFMDLAFDYDKRNGPSLQDFLLFYETKGKNTNVQIAENENAIKIMTAHKSKGLEFPVVIIPKIQGNLRTQEALVNDKNFFYDITISKKTSDKGIAQELIEKELDDTLIDELNIIYVAFTRPINRLYLFNEGAVLSKEDQKLIENGVNPKLNAEKTVYSILSSFKKPGDNEEDFVIEIGEKKKYEHQSTGSENYYPIKPLEGKLWFPEISLREKFENETDGYTEAIRLGKQFHWIMERSSSLDDAFVKLQEGLIQGFCEEKHRAALEQMLKDYFQNSKTIEILDGSSSLNERTLIVDESKRLRPDKIVQTAVGLVIIDFKTGEELPKHHKQIQEYAKALMSMGAKTIEGYLYYCNTSSYKKVNLS